ncbi:Uncharacterised protein [Salmonella enterica subsp. enterica serovar Typhi]|nr:Uncharacterised protein [Salmonella enterica subsp. enterica serovar Typhi]CHN66842.1 Uncharacterised protein [Salmonella enterica subsp. enterica serovar Typhi]
MGFSLCIQPHIVLNKLSEKANYFHFLLFHS